MKQLSKHLNFANVIASIALFVALSGAAYAAQATLGRKAVKTRNLANGAVSTLKLRSGAVTTLKLRNGAVTGIKIAPGAVGTNQLADGGVRSSDLGGGVVTSGKLKNGAVTTEKLAGGAVTEGKLGANAVSTGKIENGAVTSGKLAAGFLAQLVKNVTYVTKVSGTASTSPKTVTAECPVGKVAIAGGGKLALGEAIGVALGTSAPTAPDAQGKRIGWTATAHEVVLGETESWSLEAFAVCAEL